MKHKYAFILITLLMIIFICIEVNLTPLSKPSTYKFKIGVSSVDITPLVPAGAVQTQDKGENHLPVYIAGFGKNRRATGVHSSLFAKAVSFSLRDEYVVLVSLDLIGFPINRVKKIKEELFKRKGLRAERIIISSIHTHQGPDTIGMWGPNPLNPGFDDDYQEIVVKAVIKAVESALNNMQPAKVKFGSINIRDIDPYYNGKNFGGLNPSPKVLGLINDIRDPIIVDDTLTVMKADSLNGETICTIINWSGHPEVLGSRNTLISSDYVGYLRDRVSLLFGGETIFFPSEVGGMMSSLGADIPLRDEEGSPVYEIDEQGKIKLDKHRRPLPKFAKPESLEFARSLGYILADAVKLALNNSSYTPVNKIKLFWRRIKIPIENRYLADAIKLGIIDSDDMINNYVEDIISLFEIGPSQWVNIPGEIFPELAIGTPEDEEFCGARPNRYFPQHKEEDIKSQHCFPYFVKDPFKLKMTAKYKFVLGLANTELGYIIPECDFNLLGLFNYGDHYEETVSIGKSAASIILQAISELLSESKQTAENQST